MFTWQLLPLGSYVSFQNVRKYQISDSARVFVCLHVFQCVFWFLIEYPCNCRETSTASGQQYARHNAIELWISSCVGHTVTSHEGSCDNASRQVSYTGYRRWQIPNNTNKQQVDKNYFSTCWNNRWRWTQVPDIIAVNSCITEAYCVYWHDNDAVFYAFVGITNHFSTLCCRFKGLE